MSVSVVPRIRSYEEHDGLIDAGSARLVVFILFASIVAFLGAVAVVLWLVGA